MPGWRITIDMRGGGRIHDKTYTALTVLSGLSSAVTMALDEASLKNALPGEGEYQITATSVLR